MKSAHLAVAAIVLSLGAPLRAAQHGDGAWDTAYHLPVDGLFTSPAASRPGIGTETFGTTLFGGNGFDLGVLGRRSFGLYEPPSRQWNNTDIGLFTVGRLGGLHLGAAWSTGLASGDSASMLGLRSDLSAGYMARLGERFDLRIGLGTTWTDAEYLRGAWLEPAADPSLSHDGGFRDASIGVGACYRFAPDWSLGAELGYRQRPEVPAQTPWDGLDNGALVTGIRLGYRVSRRDRAPSLGLFGDPCTLP